MKLLDLHIENKSHVIWDWNGTLLNDIDHAVTTVNRLLEENKLNTTSLDEYRKVFGFPVVDYYERLGFDISPESFAELCVRFNDYFYSGLHLCELWPSAQDVLRGVKSSGKLQSVLSASEQKMLERSLQHFGISDVFDHVYGIADMKAGSKIDRGRQLIASAGVPREQTVLIGDTDHDFEVGEALGIEVILVEHGHQCPTRLRAIHNQVVKVF